MNPAAEKEVRWPHAVIGILWVLVYMSSTLFISGNAGRAANDPSGLIKSIWITHLVIIALPLFFLWVMRRSFPIGGFSREQRRPWYRWWLVFFVLAVVFGLSTGWHSKLSDYPGLAVVGFWIIMMCLFVGVSEEFLFRGVIQTGLNNSRLGSWKLWRLRSGTLVAAAVFASMHLFGYHAYRTMAGMSSRQALGIVVSQFVAALVLGLIFGQLYDRKRNIWGVVVLHNIVDGASYVVPLIIALIRG